MSGLTTHFVSHFVSKQFQISFENFINLCFSIRGALNHVFRGRPTLKHVLITSGRHIGHYMNINICNSIINLKCYLIHVYTRELNQLKSNFALFLCRNHSRQIINLH